MCNNSVLKNEQFSVVVMGIAYKSKSIYFIPKKIVQLKGL